MKIYKDSREEAVIFKENYSFFGRKIKTERAQSEKNIV